IALVEVTSVVEVLVSVRCVDVVAHGHLALEEARVELIVCALDELDERRRLRDVRECERPTTGERSLERGMEMQMQSLRFARARAAEADGGREQPTQAKMQERRERFVAIDAQRPRDVAERRREMAVDPAGLRDPEAARGDIE